MKISIVTAVYNREATIAEAIESVTLQDYRDIEHIIVDGGSSDGTLTEIRARLHPDMTLISERDNGIYDALNKGIGLATGEVIGLIHSDDFFAHRQVLTSVAEAFADPSVDVVYGDLDYISAQAPFTIIRHWRAGASIRRV